MCDIVEILLQHGISEEYTYLEVEEALEQLFEEQRELIYMWYLR